MTDPILFLEGTHDPDDYEYQQSRTELSGPTNDGGFVQSIFDGALSGAPRIDMYRAWVHPDIYPDERQPVLQNWSDDDLEMFCGIFKETS